MVPSESADPRLQADLLEAAGGAARFDRSTRAVYAADASNYRHLPIGLVQPHDAEEVLAVLQACRRHGAAVVSRGAGTSIGGQAINQAVVIDYSRHLNQVLDIDPAAGLARVQPGVVLDDLRRQAARHGLTFGADPSTHSRCTLGGMIGNNACGSHSVAWGKTVDNVIRLDVATYRGLRMEVGATSPDELTTLAAGSGPAGELYRRLVAIRNRYGQAIEQAFPRLPRRVSGYNLDELCGDDGCQLARALVGSEGTCVSLLEATVALVVAPPARALAVLGFTDAFTAAEVVPDLLDVDALAVEGIDRKLVAALRAARPDETVTRLLPPGDGWLYVELGGADPAEAEQRARQLASRLERAGQALGAVVTAEEAVMRQLWRVREDGAGIVTRSPDGGEAWPGWEDSAVPPERLGSYLRQLTALLERHHLDGAYYGHFGDGCVHLRVNFDLLSAPGVATFRRFMEDAADLVVAHGGSLSGEHGDGQARGELLGRMYPTEILDAFAAFKAAWDPDGAMNPRVLVSPRPLDADLRVFVAPPTLAGKPALAFSHDGGSFATATRRCVGVGRCVAASGGVMCPSYRATGEERHSTRGRARLLFEMAAGQVIPAGWRSEEVRDALDLCLSCKGCKRDCPVGVDMAAYKSEFLSHHYAGRIRPRSHYSMGFLPLWLRAASLTPRLANALSQQPAISSVSKKLGGVAPERQLPEVAAIPLVRWFQHRRAGALPADAPQAVLFPDTFTNFFDPAVGRAALAVLESLGYRVEVPRSPMCCGLTWLSTGQLGVARRVLGRTVKLLAPWVQRGAVIVGLEPSCAGLLRADIEELLPDNKMARRVAGQVRSLGEVLAANEAWRGATTSRRALAQVHCHQYAEVGYDAEREVAGRLGVDLEVLEAGCCGLAGNFGFEDGHYDVSMACAERVLLPALRGAGPDVAVVADGFSCRTQIRQATGRQPLHLAQLAAEALGLDGAG